MTDHLPEKPQITDSDKDAEDDGSSEIGDYQEAVSELEEREGAEEAAEPKDEEHEDEGLDEEDRELILENLQRKRAGPLSAEVSNKRVALESLFDDDDDQMVSQKQESEDEDEEDELADFIVEDEEEHGAQEAKGEGTVDEREVRKPTKEHGMSRRKLQGLSLLQRSQATTHLSYEVWHELMDIFGDGREYQQLLDDFSSKATIADDQDRGGGDHSLFPAEKIDQACIITDEEVDHVLRQTLKVAHADVTVTREDVFLVLRRLFVDGLSVQYVEHFEPDVSHLDAGTLWHIHDLHGQFRSVARDRQVCRQNGIIIADDLDVFDTLPDYLAKFPRSPKTAVDKQISFEGFPEPHELDIDSLQQEVPIVGKLQVDAVALRFALHPQSFHWLRAHQADWMTTLGPRCSGSMRVVLERTFQTMAPYAARAEQRDSLRRQRLGHFAALQRQYVNLLQSRSVLPFPPTASASKETMAAVAVDPEASPNKESKLAEQAIGVLYVHGPHCTLWAVVDTATGAVARPVLWNGFPDAAFFPPDCRRVVLGGRGPLLKSMSERLRAVFPDLAVHFVRPLMVVSERGKETALEEACLHLARLAIDPLTELSGHSPHNVLPNCPPEDDDWLRQRCLLPILVRLRAVSLDDVYRASKWRQGTLQQLLSSTAKSANDPTLKEIKRMIVEKAESRGELRELIPDHMLFRNVAGFIFFPQSSNALDRRLVHPDHYAEHEESQLIREEEQDLHKGSIEATDDELMSMLLGMPLRDVKRGSPLTGPVVKMDYPYAAYVRLAEGAVEGVLKRPPRHLAVGASVRGLIDRIDARRYRIDLVYPPALQADDADGGAFSGHAMAPRLDEAAPKEWRPEDAALMSKAGSHPFFRADLLSGVDVEAHFQREGVVGDMVVRMSRRKAGHVALAWKLTPWVIPQLDLEAHKGRWHVAGVDSTFEDLDEVVARIVEPAIALARQILASPKCLLLPLMSLNAGELPDHNDRAVSKLVEEMLAKANGEGAVVSYGVWLSRERPGLRAFLSSMPRTGRFVHEPIGWQLGGHEFAFRDRSFRSLRELVDWWKHNYNAIVPPSIAKSSSHPNNPQHRQHHHHHSSSTAYNADDRDNYYHSSRRR